MIVIGITGGTGAGKTTALLALKEYGAAIIDCDALYHDLLQNSVEMLCELKENFPEAFTDDVFDRKKLGKIVFADEEKLLSLNRITHFYVKEAVKETISKETDLGTKCVAIDAIALIESGISDLCDVTVAVSASENIRIKRIMEREGISEEYARLRVSAQKPESFFAENCDHVLINDFGSEAEFRDHCEIFFKPILDGNKKRRPNMKREDLFYEQKTASDIIDASELKEAFDYCKDYMTFLDEGKTERLAVKAAVKRAEANGFVPYVRGMELSAGTKVYKTVRGKALLLAVIGKKPASEGVNIAAAHIDSPRLDLKQVPLYEDGEMAFFKTHYYGGIRKYQWVTIPLELYGTVVLKNGETIDVAIGNESDDPIFVITDLLPHLAADQNKKKLPEAITGENLNILIGSLPEKDDEGSDRVKYAVLKILNEKYGIIEEDFLSAELEIVPAMNARDLGLDRSMIGAYGHDDRVCAYAELKAIMDTDIPDKTAICILADKEEIGSEGVTGMQSQAFECFVDDICASQGVKLTHCFEKSFCISADVCNAFDPNYPEVSDKRNNAKINYGVGIAKFTGARGKSGSSDASAEVVGKLRGMFAKYGVVWQTGELGKVDQGGGGTVAMYMANRNIDTIDAGVPVLSMHSPYETVSKLDCYMTYKAVKALYELG